MRGRLSVLLLLCLLAVRPARAADDIATSFDLPVQVGVMAFTPFFGMDETQNPPVPQGLLLPVLSALMREAGLPYHISVLPPQRLYRNLVSGQSHMTLSIAAIPEIDDNMLPLAAPVASLGLDIYWRADDPAPPDIPPPAWWSGKAVCRVQGFSYAGVVRQLNGLAQPPRWHVTKSRQQALLLLGERRCDYLLDYAIPEPSLEKMTASSEPALIQHQTLREVSWQVMVSANAPHALALRDRLAAAHQRLQASGVLSHLLPISTHQEEENALYPPRMPDGVTPH